MQSNGAPPSPVRRLASLALAVALGFGCYWSLRFAYADRLFRQDSPESVSRAARIVPGNAAYSARLAVLDPPSRSFLLRKAVSLSPYYSAGWMELGLLAEMERDFPAAERLLLEAAGVDGTYEPRWTLANYYFRRQHWEKFWIWTRRAAEMAYQDQTALFQLCWRATEDPQVILDRAIPDRPRAEARYLNFLLRTGRLGAAGPVASRLTRQDSGAYVSLLFDYCDHALRAGRASQALEIWNALCARELIPYRPLAPEEGRSLTNGYFAAAPLSRGFDWRTPSLPGVSVARTESPQGLRISFSGKQPERCRVIDQILPLEPSRRYSLRFLYRTSVIQPGSGLRWGITDLTSGEELLAGAKDLSSADWTEESLPFSAPPQAGLARLSLVYQRAPGTTRIEGSVFLRGISLNPGE